METSTVEIEVQRSASGLTIHGVSEALAREISIRVKFALAQRGIVASHAVRVSVSSGHRAPLDLAIAAAIARDTGVPLPDGLYLGEIGLKGEIHPVRGVRLMLEHAEEQDIETRIIPWGNAAEGSHFRCFLAETFEQVLEHAESQSLYEPREDLWSPAAPKPCADPVVQRILGAIDTGRHVLLVANNRQGWTIARQVLDAAPELEFAEAQEITRIHSVAGLLPEDCGLVAHRPLRAPHHTVSDAGLLGGGEVVRPGEVSLAHRGILLLDEVLEFRLSALQAILKAYDLGRVEHFRQGKCFALPSKPMGIIATAKACPCGLAMCKCSPTARKTHDALLERLPFERIEA